MIYEDLHKPTYRHAAPYFRSVKKAATIGVQIVRHYSLGASMSSVVWTRHVSGIDWLMAPISITIMQEAATIRTANTQQ